MRMLDPRNLEIRKIRIFLRAVSRRMFCVKVITSSLYNPARIQISMFRFCEAIEGFIGGINPGIERCPVVVDLCFLL